MSRIDERCAALGITRSELVVKCTELAGCANKPGALGTWEGFIQSLERDAHSDPLVFNYWSRHTIQFILDALQCSLGHLAGMEASDSRDWERLTAEHAELTACIGDIAALIPEDCRSAKVEKLANVRDSVGLMAQRVGGGATPGAWDWVSSAPYGGSLLPENFVPGATTGTGADGSWTTWDDFYLRNAHQAQSRGERPESPTPGTGAWAWQQMQRGPEVWVRRKAWSDPPDEQWHFRDGHVFDCDGVRMGGSSLVSCSTNTDWELCDAPKQADGSGPTREQSNGWMESAYGPHNWVTTIETDKLLRLCWTAAREGMVPAEQRDRAQLLAAEEERSCTHALEQLEKAEARVRELEEQLERSKANFLATDKDLNESNSERDQLRADLAAEQIERKQFAEKATKFSNDLAALRGEEFTREWVVERWNRAIGDWSQFDALTPYQQLGALRFANACRVRPGANTGELTPPQSVELPPIPAQRGRKLTTEENAKLEQLAIAWADMGDEYDQPQWTELIEFVESLLAPAPELPGRITVLGAELEPLCADCGEDWVKHSGHGYNERCEGRFPDWYCELRENQSAATPTPPPSELPTEELTSAEEQHFSELVAYHGSLYSPDDPKRHADSWRTLCRWVASLRSAAISSVRAELERVKTALAEERAESEMLKPIRTGVDEELYQFRDYCRHLGAVGSESTGEQIRNACTKKLGELNTELTSLRARVVPPLSEAQREELAKEANRAWRSAKDTLWWRNMSPGAQQDWLRVVDAIAPLIARVGVLELTDNEVSAAAAALHVERVSCEQLAMGGASQLVLMGAPYYTIRGTREFARAILANATGGAS